MLVEYKFQNGSIGHGPYCPYACCTSSSIVAALWIIIMLRHFSATEAYAKWYANRGLAKYEYAADVTLSHVKNTGRGQDAVSFNRTLDPSSATIITSTKHWTSDLFVSQPDHVMAWTIAPRALDSAGGSLEFEVSLSREENAKFVRAEEDALCLQGMASKPSNRRFGRPFAICVKVVCPDAGCLVDRANVRNHGDSRLLVSSSSGFSLLIATMSTESYPEAAQEFRSLQQRLVTGSIAKISRGLKRGLERLYREHVDAYRKLYEGMSVHVKETGSASKLARVANRLVAVGRYLTISSSSPTSQLPMNLQGLWSAGLFPQWNCDFHLNINLQMAYWGVHSTGLSACAKPLTRFIKDLAMKGESVVKTYYNLSQGWNAHGYTDVYKFAGPRGESHWNLCISCGAW